MRSRGPIILVASIALCLIGAIVWASRRANLWDALQSIAATPWGFVTLLDLYVGLFFVAIWIGILERRWWSAALWIIALLLLGNLVTLLYLSVRLRRRRTMSAAILGAAPSTSSS
ncbi:MAG TPA: DUF1475 family protein [Phycisphaerae bacterium]|nr:DUF1475 family protein [Phycisphaerae bacterium]HRW54247.1 DUF1475 family protein [Phycisphaerae bacterium]